MIIEDITKGGLSTWEEEVVALAYLEGVSIENGMFCPEVVQRLKKTLSLLRALPGNWAGEMSLQVVLSASC